MYAEAGEERGLDGLLKRPLEVNPKLGLRLPVLKDVLPGVQEHTCGNKVNYRIYSIRTIFFFFNLESNKTQSITNDGNLILPYFFLINL